MNAVISSVLEGPSRLRIRLRVQPRASRNRVAGIQGDRLKIQLTAPPVGGAANAALLALLADLLEVSKGALRIVSGEHSRSKIVEVQTRDPRALHARLESLHAVDKDRARD